MHTTTQARRQPGMPSPAVLNKLKMLSRSLSNDVLKKPRQYLASSPLTTPLLCEVSSSFPAPIQACHCEGPWPLQPGASLTGLPHANCNRSELPLEVRPAAESSDAERLLLREGRRSSQAHAKHLGAALLCRATAAKTAGGSPVA